MDTQRQRTIEDLLQTRLVVASIYNAAGADPKVKVTDIITLPGEDAPTLTRAQLAERDAKILKWVQQRNKTN